MSKHELHEPNIPVATLKAYAKAVVGFATPVIISLAATADGGWTTGELLTALGAGLATAAGVSVVPNRTAPSVSTATTTATPVASATHDETA